MVGYATQNRMVYMQDIYDGAWFFAETLPAA